MPTIYVAFARVVRKAGQAGLFGSTVRDEAERAIAPDDEVRRYRRTWRFSRPDNDGTFLTGKLGYVHEAESMTTSYDETVQDFIEEPTTARQAEYSRWALDLSTQDLAFELRSPEIEFQSFVGAFRGLLDLHLDARLTVEIPVQPATFFEWRRSVQRLLRFRAVLRPPNPDWADRPERLRELVDKTNATEVTLEAKADPQEGLNVEDTILGDVVAFQGEGYARVTADGVAADARRLTYDSRKKAEVQRHDVTSLLDHAGVWGLLKDLLRRRGRRG